MDLFKEFKLNLEKGGYCVYGLYSRILMKIEYDNIMTFNVRKLWTYRRYI